MTDIERWQPGAPSPGIAGDPASLGELYDSSLDEQVQANNENARFDMRLQATERRISAIERATGTRLANPFQKGRWDGDRSYLVEGQAFAMPTADELSAFQDELRNLALSRPEYAGVIKPELSPWQEVTQSTNAAGRRAEDAMATRGNLLNDPLAFGASFAGAFVGSFYDPVNIIANLAGGPGNKAKSILWNAVRQGAVNAGVQAALEPAVQAWRKEAGLEAGLVQGAQNVGFAFAFGAGLDAGGRTIARTARSLTGRADGQGGLFTDAPPPAVRPTEAALDALEQAAKARPEGDILRRAADGDEAALIELARGLNDEDPAVRGAIAELETRPDPRLDRVIEQMGIDDGSHISALAQAVRNAEVPFAEPPPARVEGLPEARGPSLSSDDPAPAARGVTFEVDGKPARLDRIEAGDIGTDAAAFQYKSGGDAAGATDRLANVGRWDEIGAGKVVVFERMNGELVIADGHQRLALAKRLEREGRGHVELDAYVLREADGWTPADVRALAAKKNLQEGSGTAIDAARILRERPDIADQSLPTTAPMLRQARALARLSDAAFTRVVSGQAEPSYAALVADLVPDKERHASVLDDLTRLGPQTQREARVAIGELLQAGARVETQMTLLGAENSVRSLLPELIKVLDQALALLRQEGRVFNALVRDAGMIEGAGNRLSTDVNAARAEMAQQAEALIERLARMRGPVSQMLDELAGAVAQGMSTREAARNFVARFQTLLDDRGLPALLRDDLTPAAPSKAFDEPLGDGAQAQVERLDAAWKERAKADNELDRDLEQMGLFKLSDYFLRTGIDAMAERLGVTSILKLRPWSKHPGKVLAFHGTQAAFDKFDLGKTTDFGLHFGTPDQANKFTDAARDFKQRGTAEGDGGRMMPVVLDLQKVVTLPDLGRWEPRSILKELEGRGVEVSARTRQSINALAETGGKNERNRAYALLREELTAQGIDGIRYINEGEGGGLTWSYIVWEKGKVTSATAGDTLFKVRDGAPPKITAADLYADGFPYTAELMVRHEIAALAHLLPDNIRIEVLKPGGIADTVDGGWAPRTQTLYIALAALEKGGVVRHEMVHAYRSLGLMTDAEFGVLRAKVDDVMDAETQALIDKEYRAAYAGRGWDARRMQEAIDEEKVAYLVEQRWRRKVSFGKTVDDILDRIIEVMERMQNALAGLGYQSFEDVIARIESGEVAARSRMLDLMDANGLTALSRKGDALFAFAGERAATADLAALTAAREMDAKGTSRDRIWRETGWFRGVDGQWRFEIDDSTSRLGGGGDRKLRSWLRHPELIDAYDDLGDIPVSRTRSGTGGAYFEGLDSIQVQKGRRTKSVGLHEVQHAIQAREDFARGGDPDTAAIGVPLRGIHKRRLWQAMDLRRSSADLGMTLDRYIEFRKVWAASAEDPRPFSDLDGKPYSPEAIALARDEATFRAQLQRDRMADGQHVYRHLAGEVEARAVQKRMDLTAEERRSRPPWKDYDVPEEEQLIARDGGSPQPADLIWLTERESAQAKADADNAMLVESCKLS